MILIANICVHFQLLFGGWLITSAEKQNIQIESPKLGRDRGLVIPAVFELSNLNASDKIMASLDVKNLFTNVSVNFTIDLVLKSVFSNNTTEFHGLTKFQLKKLLHWTCKGTVFQFNGQLFEQIDGVSMGSPIAPLLADVCMNWVLDQIPNNITQPSILIRYVDDLFCTFSDRNQLDNYFQSISNIHPNITFSKELETNIHLAYLDISINTSNGKFETSVFRKKTNTGLYTKWNSLCPLKYKRNLVRCLLSRAYKICNTWPNIHNEFETITNMLPGISRQHRDAKAFSDCLFLTTVEGLSLRSE